MLEGAAHSNTLIGQGAGSDMETGTSNTCVGLGAGNAITTGNSNIVIGENADVSAATVSDEIVIGQDAVGQGTNTVTLGHTNVTAVYAASDGDAVVYCGGINMSLNQPAADSGTMSHETLDHYEEGVHTILLLVI